MAFFGPENVPGILRNKLPDKLVKKRALTRALKRAAAGPILFSNYRL